MVRSMLVRIEGLKGDQVHLPPGLFISNKVGIEYIFHKWLIGGHSLNFYFPETKFAKTAIAPS